LALSFKGITDVFSNLGDNLLEFSMGDVGDVFSTAFLGPEGKIVRDVAKRSYEGQQREAQAKREVAPPMAYYSQSTVNESGGTIDMAGSGPVYEGGIGGLVTSLGTGLVTGLLGNLGRSGVGGAVGGAVTGYTVGQMMSGPSDSCGCGPKSFIRLNKCGQPIITRKMKKTLIDAVNNCGPEAAMQTYGLNPELMTMIISKQFPARKMGISGAQLSTTMKTARKLDKAHKLMQDYCKKTPTRRK
jgi:hypothetical protein